MSKKYLIVIFSLLIVVPANGQGFLVSSPHHLGLSASTARIGNACYAHSSQAQAFYGHQSFVTLSLYTPWIQLTDGKLQTNSIHVFLPSYAWGALNLSYINLAAENLDEPVFNNSLIQIGYSNAIFQRLIFGAVLKWNQSKWYFENHEPSIVDGISCDFSAIYVIDGHSSAGFNIDNLFSPSYSKYKKDKPVRTLRIGYLRNNDFNNLSLEGGFISEEDYSFNTKVGGFINSDFNFPLGFQIAAEYKRLFYNEIGALLAYNYNSDKFQVQLSYGIRIDDSPLPISTMQHSWGVNITLNQFKGDARVVNPQIIYNDEIPPVIDANRLGDFSLFRSEDGSDWLNLRVHAEDKQSGLDNIQLKIFPLNNSSKIVHEKIISMTGISYTDTLIFNGYQSDDTFVSNEKYIAKVIATDAMGNSCKPALVSFRVLSKLNDSNGPDISVDYDTTRLYLDPSKTEYFIDAKISINDKESDWLKWKVQLFKSSGGSDTTWKNLRPVTGQTEIADRPFKWLLRKNSLEPIQGKYKLMIEAWDELKNTTIFWSGEKRIIEENVDYIIEPVISDTPPSAERKDREPAVVFLAEQTETEQIPDERFSMQASYFYRNQEIRLTNFIFSSEQNFSVNLNKQGLSVVGVYMQELPESKLIVEYPDRIAQIPGFITELKIFFNDAYGISAKRIRFNKTNKSNALCFKIEE